ncbi:LOB domain-containing 22-like protein [Theobroma cacao]|uniref:LOB domain-containing 22-like protein n=1 Tax=Theobroma cacao TaxID=3641 RepID=A0A061GRZ6_THECC|nr:LOB domain-containing 22-like protein [Theobroma cacao]
MQRPKGNNCSAGSPACAACKYQRRKCTRNCLLAPFFPANHQKDFLNAHKLFGVSNILKIIRNLDPPQRLIAMKSIVFEANTRANDPVGGCYGIISDLKMQIDWVKAERDLVLHQLAICKAQTAAASQQQSGQQQMVQVGDHEANALQCLEGLTVYDAMPVHCREGEVNLVQGNYDDVGEDIKPLLPVFDDKGAGSFPFDSKVSIQCSDKLVSKEEVGSIQHELKHDLKSAASLFTLTNGKSR